MMMLSEGHEISSVCWFRTDDHALLRPSTMPFWIAQFAACFVPVNEIGVSIDSRADVCAMALRLCVRDGPGASDTGDPNEGHSCPFPCAAADNFVEDHNWNHMKRNMNPVVPHSLGNAVRDAERHGSDELRAHRCCERRHIKFRVSLCLAMEYTLLAVVHNT